MRYILVLVIGFAFVGCGQEQAQIPRENTVAVEVQPEPPTRAEQEARKQMALMTVNEAVQGFKVLQRRYPLNLSEVIERGLLSALPDLPEGMSFTYDSEEGAVGVAVAEKTE